MIKSFFWSKKWFWWAYGGLLLILVSLYLQVHMSVLLNTWYGDFYDLLQAAVRYGNTGIPKFYEGLIRFMWIAVPYVLLATITGYFTRLYSLRWREAITFNYIPQWRNVTEEIEGASQRIQEDAYRFARIVESLGIQVAEATMTLIAFIPILWQLSKLVDVSASPVIGKNPIILIQLVLFIFFLSWLIRIRKFAQFGFVKTLKYVPVLSKEKITGWISLKTPEKIKKIVCSVSFPLFIRNLLIKLTRLVILVLPLVIIIFASWALSKIIFAIPSINFSFSVVQTGNFSFFTPDMDKTARIITVDIPSVRSILTAQYIPGFLVWIAFIVSVGGMVISWFVGSKLPGLEYNNQKVEAAFRKELVLGEDDKINHASVPTLTQLFMGIKFNYHRLFLHYGYFDIWRGLFSQTMVIVPYVLMGHGLFTGLITLGVLQKVANSFDQVRACFSLFINNWTTVTELRSIKMRLLEFQSNLDKHQPKDGKVVSGTPNIPGKN